MNARRFHRVARAQGGLSLVELLVGMALGLLVVAGALKLLAGHLDGNRRLLLEARLHQDLRAAADLMARDLRRAGYWQSATKATTRKAFANPYSALSPAGAASAGLASYSYSRDALENDSIDSNESFGLRLAAGALQMQDGSGGWQQMTDPAIVVVTALTLTPQVQTVSLGHLCTPACSSADAACPALAIRRLDIVLRGRSAADAGVLREVRESVRVRNDAVSPAGCP